MQRPDEENLSKSLHGLTRTLIHNMVEGVTNGFSKELEDQRCRLQMPEER